MSQPPTVSVVMPVYNAQTYLQAAIESILNQTLRDFELIIVNDGSTDQSDAILKAYQQQDPRIHRISRPNTGIVGALNDGLNHAQGRYIARMDADDLALPERFAKQVDFLDDHPDYVAVGSRTLMIDPEGLPIRVHNTLTSHDVIDAAYMAGEFGSITHPAAMIRRHALQQLGGYRQEMILAEDDDLFMRLAEIGKLANLPDVLLHYRQHLESFSATKVNRGLNAAMLALQEARRRRGLDGHPVTAASTAHPSASPPETAALPDTGMVAENSTDSVHRMWAWWALADGNRGTARKHAFFALKRNPAAIASWKTLACALRGW